MLVRSAMSTPVDTVPASMSCAKVWAYFQAHNLRRAPVVDKNSLVGLVNDLEILALQPRTVEELEQGDQHAFFHTPVRHVTNTETPSIHPNDPLELAARQMLTAKAAAVPVVEPRAGGTRVIGILTETDIFKLFVRRTLMQRGHRLVLRAPTVPLAEVDPAGICAAAGAQLFDLGMYPFEGGRIQAVLQLRTDDLDSLVDTFLDAGYECVLVERG